MSGKKKYYPGSEAELSMIGHKFGKWTVLRTSETEVDYKTKFYCICECGEICKVGLYELKNGKISSCVCSKKFNKEKEYVGSKINKWTIQSLNKDYKYGRVSFFCKCECGSVKDVTLSALLANESKSCGSCCRVGKHGLSRKNSKNIEYRTYCSMIKRCYDETLDQYKNYGGRGIIVCDRWLSSFNNFILDMGIRPSKNHSIDRIDVNGIYEPGNCRWATKYVQCRNRRNNNIITHNGVSLCVTDWAFRLNVKRNTLNSFLRRRTISEAIHFYKKGESCQ